MTNEDQLPAIEEAWKGRVSIPYTRDYVKHTLFSKKKYPQGQKGLITRAHRSLLGEITHVDVRLTDGERVRVVPIDFFRSSLANMRHWWHGHSLFAGRRSTALIHRCQPFAPRTRPHHSWRSFTHQSSCPACDQVAVSTCIGGSTSLRSASANCFTSSSLRFICD
jgi:hypothetical protein